MLWINLLTPPPCPSLKHYYVAQFSSALFFKITSEFTSGQRIISKQCLHHLNLMSSHCLGSVEMVSTIMSKATKAHLQMNVNLKLANKESNMFVVWPTKTGFVPHANVDGDCSTWADFLFFCDDLTLCFVGRLVNHRPYGRLIIFLGKTFIAAVKVFKIRHSKYALFRYNLPAPASLTLLLLSPASF